MLRCNIVTSSCKQNFLLLRLKQKQRLLEQTDYNQNTSKALRQKRNPGKEMYLKQIFS